MQLSLKGYLFFLRTSNVFIELVLLASGTVLLTSIPGNLIKTKCWVEKLPVSADTKAFHLHFIQECEGLKIFKDSTKELRKVKSRHPAQVFSC